MSPCLDNCQIGSLGPLSPRALNFWGTLHVPASSRSFLLVAHFPGTGVFEASLLSGGEILQPSFIGPRIPTSLENRAFYPHLLPVLLCRAEMRLKEPKHLPQVLKKSPFDLFYSSFRNFSFAQISSGELFQLQLSPEGCCGHLQQQESALNALRCPRLAQATHWSLMSNLQPQRACSLTADLNAIPGLIQTQK